MRFKNYLISTKLQPPGISPSLDGRGQGVGEVATGCDRGTVTPTLTRQGGGNVCGGLRKIGANQENLWPGKSIHGKKKRFGI